MVLTLLPVMLLMQGPVQLTYKVSDQIVGGIQVGRRTNQKKPLPKGIRNATLYTFDFAGKPRYVAVGGQKNKRLLVVDNDGDGNLRPHAVLPIASYGISTKERPFTLVWSIAGEGTKGAYRLMLMRGSERSEVPILVSAGAWTGTVQLGDKSVPISVTDYRARGNYTDRNAVSLAGFSASTYGCSGVGRDGVYRTIEVSPLGNSVSLEERLLPSQAIPFQGDSVKLIVLADKERYLIEGTAGKVVVPTDSELLSTEIQRRDGLGKVWRLSVDSPWLYDPDDTAITVSDRESRMGLGEGTLAFEPLVAKVTGVKRNGVWTFNLSMQTAGGADVSGITVNGKTPNPPMLKLMKDGKVVSVQKFHYG